MKVVLIIALAIMTSCSDAGKTVKTLKAQGFSDIETTGYYWFGCGKDDFYSTGFKAKNPKGKNVEGVVCCGMFMKGCTTRF